MFFISSVPAQIGKNKNKKDCLHEDLNSKETNLKEITLH